MKLTVHISTPIRSVVKELPATMVMERTEPLTIRQLAIDIGIPPLLVVFATVNRSRRGLDALITEDSEILFVGTMAGG